MKHIRRIVIVLIWLLIWQFASMMTGLELLLASPVAVLKNYYEYACITTVFMLRLCTA